MLQQNWDEHRRYRFRAGQVFGPVPVLLVQHIDRDEDGAVVQDEDVDHGPAAKREDQLIIEVDLTDMILG